MSPTTELANWITDSLARCRAQRWHGAAFRFDVANDIAADVAVQQQTIARRASAAEQSDIEAAQIIEAATRDGLSDADLPAFRRAVRLIRSSAANDNAIVELARP